MSTQLQYTFSISGTFTGSVSGNFAEELFPRNKIIGGIRNWRDFSQLEPSVSASISSSEQIASGSATYYSESLMGASGNIITGPYSTVWTSVVPFVSGNVTIEGASIPHTAMCFVPAAASHVSGNAFTVYADIQRPLSTSVPLYVPLSPTSNIVSGTTLLMDPSGTLTFGTTWTITPFIKYPTATNILDKISSFQSTVTNGFSIPISLSFSQPVYAVTVTAGDPTYAGNIAYAYSASVLVQSESFAYSGTPGRDLPDTKILTGSTGITEVYLQPAASDYLYYSVLVTERSGTLPNSTASFATKAQYATSVGGTNGVGSGVAALLTGMSAPCGFTFRWADYAPSNTVTQFYTGSDWVTFEASAIMSLFSTQGPLIGNVNPALETGNSVLELQYTDGTRVSGSFTLPNRSYGVMEWQRGTSKRMGMDVFVQYDTEYDQNDIWVSFWIQDPNTGQRASFTEDAYYLSNGYRTAWRLNADLAVSWRNMNDLAEAILTGSAKVIPAAYIANLQVGSASWGFSNLTVKDNFRGIVNGAFDGAVYGNIGARFIGYGELTGSAQGLFYGNLTGSASGSGSVNYFETKSYSAFSSYDTTMFNGRVSVIGSPVYNVSAVTGSYLYRSTFAVAAPTASTYTFTPPVVGVRFTQYDANIASGTIRAYDPTGVLLEEQFFASGASTRTITSSAQNISKVALTPNGTDYVYWSGPSVAFLPGAYSGALSGTLSGSFFATSSFFSSSLVFVPTGTLTTSSSTLIGSMSVSFNYGFSDVTSSRTGLIVNAYTGSPQITLEPTPVNPYYLVPGDIWFMPSASRHALFYADYSSSLTGTIAYQVLATEIPDTIYGGTW
jgi:hypothetical protein